MKKIVLGLFAITLAIMSSCSNDESSKDESINLNGKSSSFIDIQKKFGAALEITDFDASNQTSVTLPKGTIINIPQGALTNGTSTYTGKVHVMSREFTSLADLTFSNFQTVDTNNNLLVTGGSYAIIFLDDNYKKLGINRGFEVEVKFPSKIKSAFSDRMNIYDGRLNEKNNVQWSITNKKTDYDTKYYDVKFNSIRHYIIINVVLVYCNKVEGNKRFFL